ncbi:MAG: caspase family protein, partial [Planctomycetota bacterium]
MRRGLITLLMLTASLWCASAALATDKRNVYALVIGLDAYGGNTDTPPDADALSVAARFRGTFGFDPDVLTNDDATMGAVRRRLLETIPSLPAESFIFIYFAGHGEAIGDELVLQLHAATPNDPYSASVHVEDIFRAVKRVPRSRALIILDCCYSGGRPNWLIDHQADFSHQNIRVVGLASSARGEQTKGGVFTRTLLEYWSEVGQHCTNAFEIEKDIQDRIDAKAEADPSILMAANVFMG